jgi:hypothetical protein
VIRKEGNKNMGCEPTPKYFRVDDMVKFVKMTPRDVLNGNGGTILGKNWDRPTFDWRTTEYIVLLAEPLKDGTKAVCMITDNLEHL